MPSVPSPKYYVYVLARQDGRPFYVGKGSGRRIWNHETEARRNCNCHRCNIIRKIWKQGNQVQRYIVFETDNEQEAYDYEASLVEMYGRETLANLTPGGLGGVALTDEQKRALSIRARNRTPEQRERYRQGTKRYFETHEHPNKGKPLSEAQKEAIRARRSEHDWWKGNHHSEETKQKMSEAQKGRIITLETRGRMAIARAKPYPALIHLETGEIIPAGRNIKALCLDRGLIPVNLARMIAGKHAHHKGWVVFVPDAPLEPPKPPAWKVLPYPSLRHRETGEIIPAGQNRSAMCRERGLDIGLIGDLIRGEVTHHKGWVVHIMQEPQAP